MYETILINVTYFQWKVLKIVGTIIRFNIILSMQFKKILIRKVLMKDNVWKFVEKF